MNCDQASERLAELVRGELAPPETEALREHLRGCPACAREAEELPALWAEMAALPEETPSPALRQRFYAMLAEERRRPRRAPLGERLERALAALCPRRPAWQAALAAALLAVGILLGRTTISTGAGRGGDLADLRGEVRSLSRLVALSLLQQDSAASRLQGVAYGRRAAATDERVLDALVEVATHDPSVNVRLAAIDALAPALDRPAVRDEMLASFARQPSPLLQVALVDAVVAADGGTARRTLGELLQLPNLDPAVRRHLGKAVGTVS